MRCADAPLCESILLYPRLYVPSIKPSPCFDARIVEHLEACLPRSPPHTYRQRYRCASESKPTLCSIRRNRRLLLIIECWGNEKKERKKEEKAGMHESRRRDFPCSSNARSFECCFVVRDIRVERRSRTIVGERGYLELILI